MSQVVNSGRFLGRGGGFLLVLAMGVLVAGCASSPSASDETGASTAAKEAGVPASELTVAEQRMRRQSEAFQRTVWEGALTGATAGAVFQGWLAHGIKGAASAAGIGGAAGGLSGAYLAKKQREFAEKEDQLESMIGDVQRSNREAEALIATIREVIAEDRARLAAVESRYRAGQAKEAELVAARRRIDANRAVVQSAVRGAREQRAMYAGAEVGYRTANPKANTAALTQQLEAYQQNIDTLGELADTIVAA
jgi:outer membrane lipoprotein SlyB